MDELIKLIDNKLDEYIKVQEPKSIFESMKYTLMLPGKRLRPMMCLETVRMLNGDIADALPTACAIEMLHAQSLIHDDLPCMDNDDYRRGKLSNHKVFGEAIAVLAGDALLSYAPQMIIENSTKLTNEKKLRLVHEFVKFAGAFSLIGGQVADIEAEKGKYLYSKEKTLEYIHLNKTAVLFRLAMRSGAIIANANESTLEKMDEFATKFGLLFQIYDDIMDEISDFKEMGKTTGKDKNAGKLTYVSLYGIDESKEKLNLLINECYGIINEYNSSIFEEILAKIKKRVIGA